MGRRLALIVGNADYQDPKLARLVAPTEDVRSLAEVLRNPQIGAFDDVATLLNETGANIRKAVSLFFLRKDRDDLLLFYFSGHGVRDDRGDLYLAVKDTEADVLSGTAIEAGFITNQMDTTHSRRQVLILDCCHSAAFARGTKAAIGESVGTGAAFDGTGYGRIVLTASDATQFAWDAPQDAAPAVTPSVFTRHLVEGLRTGDADTDNDGQITLDEWYHYTYSQVIIGTSKQTPKKFTYDLQGDVLIAKNPRAGLTPVDIPDELVAAIHSPFIGSRVDAVAELQRLLKGRNKGLSRAAEVELTKLSAADDSSKVRILAHGALEGRVGSANAPVDVSKPVVIPSPVPPPAAVPRIPDTRRTTVDATRHRWPSPGRLAMAAAALGAFGLLAIFSILLRPTSPYTGGPSASATAGPSLTSSALSQFVAVPNVYNLLQQDGTRALSDMGFAYVIWPVCSSSVAANHIRQVVLIDSSNNVTDILVDQDGVTAKGSQLARGTNVAVKVANGAPCTQ